MKRLRVKFSDGKAYDIPAEYIARQRAEYYAEGDVVRSIKEEYKEEYREKAIQYEIEYALNNFYEIYDWACNNMDWKDVKDVAVLVDAPHLKVDYEKEWCNANMKLIDIL